MLGIYLSCIISVWVYEEIYLTTTYRILACLLSEMLLELVIRGVQKQGLVSEELVIEAAEN